MDIVRSNKPSLFDYAEFNAHTIEDLRGKITSTNCPATAFIISGDLWHKFVGIEKFVLLFDPITTEDLVLRGSVGSILGLDLFTDAFRQPTSKVLDTNEMIMLGLDSLISSKTFKCKDVNDGIEVTETIRLTIGNIIKGSIK